MALSKWSGVLDICISLRLNYTDLNYNMITLLDHLYWLYFLLRDWIVGECAHCTVIPTFVWRCQCFLWSEVLLQFIIYSCLPHETNTQKHVNSKTFCHFKSDIFVCWRKGVSWGSHFSHVKMTSLIASWRETDIKLSIRFMHSKPSK